jgi:hypothetical protein
MIVVLPRVSTAGSLRMIARRLAIRATPMARVMVIAAGSPFGDGADGQRDGGHEHFESRRTAPHADDKVSTASRPMAISSQLLKTAILRVSGVVRSGASAISCEMRPVSVRSPVATTTPAPRPVIITVPA